MKQHEGLGLLPLVQRRQHPLVQPVQVVGHFLQRALDYFLGGALGDGSIENVDHNLGPEEHAAGHLPNPDHGRVPLLPLGYQVQVGIAKDVVGIAQRHHNVNGIVFSYLGKVGAGDADAKVRVERKPGQLGDQVREVGRAGVIGDVDEYKCPPGRCLDFLVDVVLAEE